MNRKGDGEERRVRGLRRYLERVGGIEREDRRSNELVARVRDRNKLEVVAVKK